MNILVTSITDNDNSTLSQILVDGKFECFGLEDEDRAFKIPGQTRIPRGKYEIGIRLHGGFHSRYSSKFPDIHKGMLEILDVPNFTDVLIHCGNTHEDTAGCLLVGTGAETKNGLRIINSVIAYKLLYTHAIEAALANNLTIEYV